MKKEIKTSNSSVCQLNLLEIKADNILNETGALLKKEVFEDLAKEYDDVKDFPSSTHTKLVNGIYVTFQASVVLDLRPSIESRDSWITKPTGQFKNIGLSLVKNQFRSTKAKYHYHLIQNNDCVTEFRTNDYTDNVIIYTFKERVIFVDIKHSI